MNLSIVESKTFTNGSGFIVVEEINSAVARSSDEKAETAGDSDRGIEEVFHDEV